MPSESFDIKKRLMRLVEEYPGLHLRELARQADISEALAGYHLDRLVEEDHVESRTEKGFRRFYPAGAPAPTEDEQEMLSMLRRATPLEIVVYLLEEGPSSHREITDQLDLAKSTVSYHLDKLREAGIVVQDDEGLYMLDDPRGIERLLIRWEPPTGLTDQFADLWERFYYHER